MGDSENESSLVLNEETEMNALLGLFDVPGLFTEVFWASLHGVATLTRSGRLPPEETEPRVKLLVDRLPIV